MKKSAILIAITFLSMGSAFATGRNKKNTTSSAKSEVSVHSLEPQPGFDIAISPSVEATLDIFDQFGNIVYHHYFHNSSLTSKVYNLSQLPEGTYRVKTIANKVTTNQFIKIGN